MCSYAIWNSDSDSGSASPLYWGLVRDRGTVRTSIMSRIFAFRNKSTNTAIGRVECPMVKNGCALIIM